MTDPKTHWMCWLLAISFSINYCQQLDPFLETNSDQNLLVVGGEPAKNGQFPHQLSMRWKGRHFCGATFVHSYFITGRNIAITAAHCVAFFGTGKFQPPKHLTVVGGSVLLSDNSSAVQTSKVWKVIIHESYAFPENDIAILVLSEHFRLSDTLKPAELPEKNEEYHGNLTVSGWGATREGSTEAPDHLQFAVVPVIENDICAVFYSKVIGDELVVFPSNICAGFDEGGIDTCQGDSGGPATSLKKLNYGYGHKSMEKHFLQGVTSWGIGCARAELPGVYTRMSFYVDWVKENVAFFG